MKNYQLDIKNKIINHLTINGKKNKGEKILLKAFKELQESSNKQSKELIKFAIILSTPIFKLHKISQKKRKKKKTREIPSFIPKENPRVSAAIKFILKAIREKKAKKFYDKLKNEVLFNAQFKGNAMQIKNELQKQILLKKRYFLYFRWR